jgi:hypothetical protein
VQTQLQLHDTPISRARKQLTGFRVGSLGRLADAAYALSDAPLLCGAVRCLYGRRLLWWHGPVVISQLFLLVPPIPSHTFTHLAHG